MQLQSDGERAITALEFILWKFCKATDFYFEIKLNKAEKNPIFITFERFARMASNL